MKNQEKPLNVMIASLCRNNRTAESVKRLDRLRNKGLVDKIVVLDSSPDSTYKYPEDISPMITTEIQRKDSGNLNQTMHSTLESRPNDKKGFNAYVKDIRDTVNQYDIDMVMPTSDIGVYTLSKILSAEKRSTPDLGLVNLFQDKSRTYDFFRIHNVARSPNFMKLDLESLSRKGDDIKRFIDNHEGIAFGKPSRPQIGGSWGTGSVRSIEELRALMESNKDFGDYLLSEKLYRPEINHTLVLNNDGSVNTQGSYSEMEGERTHSTPRITIKVPELNEFGHNFGYTLKAQFPDANIRGAYNIDFMRDSDDQLVMSEVNPGRFPSNFGAFKPGKFNLLEPLVSSFKGKSEKYKEQYHTGLIYQSA